MLNPKYSECKACLAYWDVGIVYCTCGHFLRDDTTEKKKYIKLVLDLFPIPNYHIRKGRPYGKEEGDQEYHTANQLQKKCKEREFLSIHDRLIFDARFRKTMIELGRIEEVIREMDKLANEDHTHHATEEELDVYRSKRWIRSNFVGSDTMSIKHRPDFKEALSTLRRIKNREDQAYYQNRWQNSSSSSWNWQDTWWHHSSEPSPRRMDPALIDRGNLRNSDWANYSWIDSQNELDEKYSDNSLAANAVYCHRWVVERVYLQVQKNGYGNATTKTTTT